MMNLKTKNNFKPLITAGTILGLGMGGFVDGILFHQILQLHSMLSNRLFPDTLINVEINMFWDGLFHAFTWIMTLIGLALLWKAVRRVDVPKSTKILVGSMLFGWGLFNLVEGIIDHQLLQVHHVVQRAAQPAQLYWDLLFLAAGIVLIVLGRVLIQSGRKAAPL
ncbi:MAG: DUF2243 domain-containing protein [Deltaproteobacteria bacterium]|nr:DUF2243 domain-containing protein [Deltaproteobacteria bacterium]